MMLTEISTILASISSARQIASAVVDLRDFEMIRDKISEFKDRLSDAQDGIFRVGQERNELANKISNLELALKAHQEWESEVGRYELVALAPGRFAMRLKSTEGREPQHYLCANCFTEMKKKYLINHSHARDYFEFKCNDCGKILTYSTGRSDDAHFYSTDY